MPSCGEMEIYGADWPNHGYDEWFLQTALYPRVAMEGLLTFVPSSAKSRLLPLDIEYTTWANPASEMAYFGPSGEDNGCCGESDLSVGDVSEQIAQWQRPIEMGLLEMPEINLPENFNQKFMAAKNHLIGLITTCRNRWHHLEKTLPVNLETLRKTPVGFIVVVDYSCESQTAQKLTSQYSKNIDEGRLIVMRVEGKEKFNAGEAKALGHSLAHHKADHLFNLDADNYLETADMVTLIETIARQSNYVAQQYQQSADNDTYGRIMTTSALYHEVEDTIAG
jgi:hypothetical protein